MRAFGKVAPQFWTGKTGKSLRGCLEAQVVALYLMTSPHATMIGVYSLPMLYLMHETGLSEEGASKGLERCIEGGFCAYDEDSETVFVFNMAAHQIGEVLKPGDKRANAVRSQFKAIASGVIRAAFFDRYGVAFGLDAPKVHSPLEGASEGAFMPQSPSPSTSLSTGGVGEKRRQTAKRPMPEDFGVSDRVRAWAAEKGHDRLDQHLESFRAKAQAKGYAYVDWDAAFMEAIRENWAKLGPANVIPLAQQPGGGRRAL